MLRIEIVEKIRLSTCAVLRLDQRHEDLLAGASLSSFPRPQFNVVGTAFLVRPNLALTNRHVVELIATEHTQSGNHDHWYLEFNYPRPDRTWATSTQRIKEVFALIDPKGGGAVDVGLLGLKRPDDPDFEKCAPVEFGELDAIRIGSDVAICGFPLGNELLVGKGIWRFGPVVHRGLISGVAPFNTVEPRQITAFLTDLNSAGGMSGSPVFTPDDGKVVGLHFAGAAGTLGAALPIDRQRVDGWVRFYERVFIHGDRPELKMTAGGDVVET